MTSRRIPRGRLVLACTAVGVLVAAAVALAMSGGSEPSHPTRSASPLLSIGQPIKPYRAGKPPTGFIEMRITSPDGRHTRAVLYYAHSKLRRGKRVLEDCTNIGAERWMRHARTDIDISCLDRAPASGADPLSLSTGWGTNEPVTITGQASRDVARLVVEGPGGTYTVPLARHRAFILMYSHKARGTATLTAHMRDGSTRFYKEVLPPTLIPTGTAQARDPGGRFAWHVSAGPISSGPHKGQTCAQFGAERLRRDSADPLCGDLSNHPMFAGAQRHASRLVVWGAVAPSAREIRMTDAKGTRRLALSAVGRAFIAVYPADTNPATITLAVTRADGSVERHAAPRLVSARIKEGIPQFFGPPVTLRVSGSNPDQIVISATLTTAATKLVVTLGGRQVRLHRAGGSGRRLRYAGIYDTSRGKRHTFTRRHIYGGHLVICSRDACGTIVARARLR
jgi:hypothetical protein